MDRALRRQILIAATVLLLPVTVCARDYAPGISERQIKIGQTMPYSGPASAYGAQGSVQQAYFAMVNAKGGVNGRKILLISLDDAYNPTKTVEQTRRLVEQDEVFAIIGTVGTPTNSAIQRYLNDRKVPHLFVASGAAKWDDPKRFPYTTQLYPPYQMEGKIFAQYLLKNKPDAKLGILSQNDDAGRDYVKGLKDGLGAKSTAMIVKEINYETTDPTIESQIVALKASGADTLFTMTTPKFGAQAIRKIAELGWKPLNFIASVSSSIAGVLEPAGLQNSNDLLTALASKTATDPRWAKDKDVIDFFAFLKEWYPKGDVADGTYVTAYISAFMTVHLLQQCGDDLTQENLLKQATRLNGIAAPMLLPGITISTRPDRYSPYNQMQIARFDGKSWVLLDDVISANFE